MALTGTICNAKTDSEGRELVLHGTDQFPLACYADDLSLETVPWHWHDEMETIVVAEGCAGAGAGTEKYILRRGEGILINSGVLHSVWQEGPDICRLHSMVFHPRLPGGSIDSVFWQKYMKPLTEDVTLKSVPLSPETDWQKKAIGFLESAWHACVRDGVGYEFEVRAGLSGTFALLMQNRPAMQKHPSEKSLRNAERMKLMLHFIQEHYMEELSLAQIAASATVSVSECLRCFHETIGETPVQYVKRYRIQISGELLSTTSMKIADIATSCGFQDMSYFSRSFKEIKGCTPSAYRAIL